MKKPFWIAGPLGHNGKTYATIRAARIARDRLDAAHGSAAHCVMMQRSGTSDPARP
jgi:hypothetical protein